MSHFVTFIVHLVDVHGDEAEVVGGEDPGAGLHLHAVHVPGRKKGMLKGGYTYAYKLSTTLWMVVLTWPTREFKK